MPSHTLVTASLEHFLALRRRGVVPLLLQCLALFLWKLLETAVILAHRGLLARRKRLESLPALSQGFALLRRQGMPAIKALACQATLVGGHSEPALTATGKRLLPLRRKRVPLVAEAR